MDYESVSVLVPTRGRAARLELLIESFERTRGIAVQELIFRVDDDDSDSISATYAYKTVIGPRFDGYGSMPTFFNELAHVAMGDVLLCGNDDMVFQTKGWADRLLDEARKYPDGVFDLGVTTHNETHFPFSIVSRKVVDTLGFIWDPRIFWGDIYLRDVMARLGRTIMVPSVRIDHDWAGYRPDRVFAETRTAKERVESDPGYWPGIHTTAVSEAVEKLSGLLA